MELKQLLQDEDAVSPVIGVILMVAITVILAAVIGTFVLGLGDQVQSSAPNANFQFSYSGSDVTVTHNGGQDIDATQVEIQTQDSSSPFTWADNDPTSADDTISTGDTVTVAHGGSGTVRVVWTSASGGTSNTIGESTVPS